MATFSASWLGFVGNEGYISARLTTEYTSQICPNCGIYTGKKDLSECTNKCRECHYEINCDVAAAKVICHQGVTAVCPTVVQQIDARWPIVGSWKQSR
ncbi:MULTISPECIES: zinc ribbon domain-containing protein [unclassified Okeania]|uniref:zinc ribbon domain-containing protein n=1 Tax=unclassified Okeania TaxID=2634635 RepID=UPI00338FDC89